MLSIGSVATAEDEAIATSLGEPASPKTPSVTGRFSAPLERDSLRRRTLAVADILALCAAYGLVWALNPPHGPVEGKLVLAGALPLWVLLNKLLGLYDRDANVISKSTLDELPAIVQSVVLGTSLVFLLAPLVPIVEVGRDQTLTFIGAALVLTPLLRMVTRSNLDWRAEPERCLIVGSGAVARQLADKLSKHPEFGVSLVGFLDELPGGHHSHDAGPTLLGGVDDFHRVCEDLGVERVILAFSAQPQDLLTVLQASKALEVKVSVLPRLFEAMGDAVEIEQVEGMTLLGLRGLSRTRSSLRLKRAIDIGGAVLGLVLLSPLLLAIAVAVKLDSRGPVLFGQRRIGRDNRAFRMYKFRTMHPGAERLREKLSHLNEASEPMFKIADDPRLTRIGRRLRQFSLDELPQLWNVLRGEMSLVGPRPLVPDEDARVLGPHRARLDITPGLTGPWQVLGRTRIPFEEMVRLDYVYVAEWSLWNDIKLLLRTAPVVLNGRGH